MADVAKIIERIRAAGANVELDAGKLRIVNSKKLPEGALAFIKQHGKDIAAFVEREGDFNERAAIAEFEGGLQRRHAEEFAAILLASPPAGCNPADWTWFVSKAAEIADTQRRAA